MTPERYQKLQAILNSRQPDLSVLMEDVHKPRNFAAILRSCDAVGVFEAHAVAPDGIPFHRPKAAAGSTRWVKIRTHDAIEEGVQRLKSRGMTVIAAHPSPTAMDFRDYDYTQPTTIIMGSELDGLSDKALELTDETVMIPMSGMVQSLNVSVSAALILFEAQRQRQQARMYEARKIDDETYHRLIFEWGYPKLAHFYRQRKLAYPPIDEETGQLIRDAITVR
ncbi:MAG: tRNA (guanosine(18)-2'-O)-methyltransferase TrmH [Gammaproteobacteria bacterium]|nr:tRNA (guanosine(18)-2'-O)-methyltransferase TrmH [Gammaproteobacteria bacterium]